MWQIRTSGLMSGEWKRNAGQAIQAPATERAGHGYGLSKHHSATPRLYSVTHHHGLFVTYLSGSNQLWRVHLLAVLTSTRSLNLIVAQLSEQPGWRQFAWLRHLGPTARMFHEFRQQTGVSLHWCRRHFGWWPSIVVAEMGLIVGREPAGGAHRLQDGCGDQAARRHEIAAAVCKRIPRSPLLITDTGKFSPCNRPLGLLHGLKKMLNCKSCTHKSNKLNTNHLMNIQIQLGIKHHTVLGVVGLAALFLLATNYASAQTTIASDSDTAAIYGGFGTPYAGLNAGYGYGVWVVGNIGGASGEFNNYPNGWEVYDYAVNSSASMIRPFNTPLSVGDSVSLTMDCNTFDGPNNSGGILLQDSSGNTLFSYYHQGDDTANGWYTDAGGARQTATGFGLNYGTFSSLTFTLTSPTTYTFTDNTYSESLNGTISGTISQFGFFRSNINGETPSGGQDFLVNDLTITSVPEPSALALASLGVSLLFVIRRRSVQILV